MKKLILIFAILFTLLCTIAMKGQDQSMLYKISGNGLEQDSYLFGTIHLQCTSDFEIKDKVMSAIDSTTKIYFEVDLDDPELQEKLMADMLNGKKLSEELTKEELTKLDVVTQDRLGMTVEMLDNYNLGIVAGLLSFSEIKCEEKSAYESELMKIALEKGMEVKGIETVEYQLETLKEGWDKESALDHIHNQNYYDLVQIMLEAYLDEDLGKLCDAVMNEEFMNEKEILWGLEKRNSNWVELMPDIMKNQSTFFVFGAGHLGADIGVIQLLKNQGYTVTPIFDKI